MASTPSYDVFISYRWVDPDMTWVREHLAPALRQAGLRVLLDVEDFEPGRDVMLEMERAGRQSRHAICVISPDYFAGNRMVGFESLMFRRSDPSGMESRMIPLILRRTEMPDRFAGLIPVDWTEAGAHGREWTRLLEVLEAPRRDVLGPGAVGEPSRPRAESVVRRLRNALASGWDLPRVSSVLVAVLGGTVGLYAVLWAITWSALAPTALEVFPAAAAVLWGVGLVMIGWRYARQRRN
jgi:hypothetical protein